jgi:hypothetical protein
MANPELINYKGKDIYFMDFSKMKSKRKIENIIDKSIVYIRNQPPNSLLTLTDISKMHFNSEIKDLFTEFVKGNKPYVKAGTVIGISGLQSIVYNAIMKLTGRNVKSMKSFDEAKEWLVNFD